MVGLFLWQHLHIIRRADVCGSIQCLYQTIIVTLFLLRFFRLIVPTKINLQAESCAAVSVTIIEPFFGVSLAP